MRPNLCGVRYKASTKETSDRKIIDTFSHLNGILQDPTTPPLHSVPRQATLCAGITRAAALAEARPSLVAVTGGRLYACVGFRVILMHFIMAQGRRNRWGKPSRFWQILLAYSTYTHHITTCLTPSDFQTFLRPCGTNKRLRRDSIATSCRLPTDFRGLSGFH